MKIRRIASLTLGVFMLAGVGCTPAGGNASGSSSRPPAAETDTLQDVTVSVPEGYLELRVADSGDRLTEGYGCQVDTHIFKEAYNNFYEEDDWTEWLARIDDMHLQTIRTQVFPEWYERGNDNSDPNVFDESSPNVDFNSIEMQQLYRLLDICEERGIKVDLSFYGCNRIFESQDGQIRGSWLANGCSNWITAPKTVDENGMPFAGYAEYAESVSVLLHKLIDEKGYTCIYEFSMFPEPNGSFFASDGSVDDAEFAVFCKTVADKLKKDGMWGKALWSGPGDCANDHDRYRNYLAANDGIFEKGTSSVYKFNDESTNAEMYEFAKTNVSICDEYGISWGVCESGSNRFVDAANQSDVDTYNRAVFLARTVINYANAGATNVKYWVLNDVNYGGYIMRLGLWKEIDAPHHAQARPQFYSWSLITKYTDIGSRIYPVESSDPDICMTAYRLPDGSWTYLIANSGTTVKRVSVVSRHSTAQKSMKVYELSGATVPTDNRTVKSSRSISMNGGVLSLTVRSNSFTVISNKVR